MKFIMVLIICFGADCRSVYENFAYETYEQCVQEAVGVSQFMQQQFPTSSGQVFCWDKEQFELFQKGLKDGFDPSITNEGPLLST